MEMTNNNEDLAIASQKEFPVVTDGTYEAEYKGFKPFQEESAMWGHKEGVRLQFQIMKGPFKGQYVSFKGNYYQEQATGKWFIGRKSKLAEVIRVMTGGGERLKKEHLGMRLFIVVSVNTTKSGKNAGKQYSNVVGVMALPSDYTPAPAIEQRQAQRPAPAQTAPVQQPPAAAAPAATTTVGTAAPAPAPQPAPAAQQQHNADILSDLDGLDDLSDFSGK